MKYYVVVARSLKLDEWKVVDWKPYESPKAAQDMIDYHYNLWPNAKDRDEFIYVEVDTEELNGY